MQGLFIFPRTVCKECRLFPRRSCSFCKTNQFSDDKRAPESKLHSIDDVARYYNIIPKMTPRSTGSGSGSQTGG